MLRVARARGGVLCGDSCPDVSLDSGARLAGCWGRGVPASSLRPASLEGGGAKLGVGSVGHVFRAGGWWEWGRGGGGGGGGGWWGGGGGGGVGGGGGGGGGGDRDTETRPPPGRLKIQRAGSIPPPARPRSGSTAKRAAVRAVEKTSRHRPCRHRGQRERHLFPLTGILEGKPPGREALRQAPSPPRAAPLTAFIDVALQSAHDHGVIHAT